MDLDGKWFYCQKIFIAFIIFSDKVSKTAAVNVSRMSPKLVLT